MDAGWERKEGAHRLGLSNWKMELSFPGSGKLTKDQGGGQQWPGTWHWAEFVVHLDSAVEMSAGGWIEGLKARDRPAMDTEYRSRDSSVTLLQENKPDRNEVRPMLSPKASER